MRPSGHVVSHGVNNMDIQAIVVPYDSGHRGLRLGRGPEHLLERGLERRLGAPGHAVRIELVEANARFPSENKTTFELLQLIAERVGAARARGAFPLVLSGNCNSAVGALAGLDPARTGLIWFDAHGEFNTPETTSSGFLDGMGLAIAVGRCWQTIARTIPGYQPLPEANAILVGGRDLDAEERRLLQGSGIALVRDGQIAEALTPALAALRRRVEQVYVHIDLDILDPREARASSFAAPGGLTLAQMDEAIRAIGRALPLGGAGLAAYDPACDSADRTLGAAFRLLEDLIAAAVL